MTAVKPPNSSLVNLFKLDMQLFLGDVSLHANGITSQNLDYIQLSSGFYEGQLATLLISPNLSIYYKRFNQTLDQTGRCPPDKYQLVFRLSGDTAKMSGRIFEEGSFILAKPGAELESFVKSNSESVIMFLCAKQLNSIFLSMGVTQNQLKKAPSFSVFNNNLQYSILLQLLQQGAAFYQRDPSELIHSKLLDSYCHSIMHLLAGYLLQSWTEDNDSPVEQKELLLSRAKYLIRSRSGVNVAPNQLAQEVGVSRRKLEYLFRDKFDISPAEYIRIVKLNELRRRLSAPKLSGYSIGDIAGGMEIWHLGRLSKYYRDQFGELPSSTRERLITNQKLNKKSRKSVKLLKVK